MYDMAVSETKLSFYNLKFIVATDFGNRFIQDVYKKLESIGEIMITYPGSPVAELPLYLSV